MADSSPIPRLPLLRYLLIIPAAACLAFVIILNDPFQRALAVAVLVVTEIIRDAATLYSLSGMSGGAGEAKRKKKPGRRQARPQ